MNTKITLITPETQPVFPCWLWDRWNKRWLRLNTVCGFSRSYDTHWHPDQETAPTEVPTERYGPFDDTIEYHQSCAGVPGNCRDAPVALLEQATPPTAQALAEEVAKMFHGTLTRETTDRIAAILTPVLAAAQADTKRLDWLAVQIGPGYAGGIVMVANLMPTHGGDFRAAIDAAIQGDAK